MDLPPTGWPKRGGTHEIKSDKSDKTNNDGGSFAVRPAAERSDKSDKPDTCIRRVARHPSLRLCRGFVLLDTNRASRRSCQTSVVGTSYPCGRRTGPFGYPHSSWLNSALHFWTSPNTWVHALPNSCLDAVARRGRGVVQNIAEHIGRLDE